MKNLLSEELERYRTLTNYNTKLTLTENTILSEQPAATLKALEDAFRYGKPVSLDAKVAAKQLQRAQERMKDLMSKLNFKSSQREIEAFLIQGEKDFNNSYKNAIKTDITNGHTMVGQTGPAAKELSKIEVLRKIANDKPTTSLEIDKIIKEIKVKNDAAYASAVAKIKTKTKTPGPVTPPGPVKPPGPGGASGANRRRSKRVGAANPGLVARIKAGMSWPTLLKVGAGIATVGVLWWLFTDNSPLPDPPPNPDPEPNPNPTPNPTPESKYKTCPDTFPIAMYCKNETVRKVQGCLSIKTDGAFGTGTQTALVAKGLPGTEITQNTVDVACGSKVVEPVVDPNVELIDGEDGTKI